MTHRTRHPNCQLLPKHTEPLVNWNGAGLSLFPRLAPGTMKPNIRNSLEFQATSG